MRSDRKCGHSYLDRTDCTQVDGFACGLEQPAAVAEYKVPGLVARQLDKKDQRRYVVAERYRLGLGKTAQGNMVVDYTLPRKRLSGELD